MRRTTLIALSLLAGLCPPSNASAQDPDWVKEIAPKRIVYAVPGMSRVRVRRDLAGLNAGMDRFVQAALSKNLTVEVFNHAAGHHGFDVEDDDERTREIIRRAVEFIRAHV